MKQCNYKELYRICKENFTILLRGLENIKIMHIIKLIVFGNSVIRGLDNGIEINQYTKSKDGWSIWKGSSKKIHILTVIFFPAF
ncbi:hypothetical protein MXL46_07240 [Heyndrickxia sporothermodurans]|nr:hypothetical protein [Heyndrickxia sporothermodurans]MBL5772845.1 hypothetical protein [Heyndrickxia sporothermodurans]MBL5779859.1 hypothetical protein [Heyndrickxia sporothermodurans]MBL5782242.1 hypothetical protein [Heyndrickxia sporothermodurans]MBL5790538.1 hypothetical protein [Heyndrickxia sporothermodurans]MBL5793112.1 hypothetical protein [Heyndrickxia sporothermodurans]